MARATHPEREIEMALRYAQWQGWRIEVGGEQAWGMICCPQEPPLCLCGEFRRATVWRWPKCPNGHARALCRLIDNCTLHQLRRTGPLAPVLE